MNKDEYVKDFLNKESDSEALVQRILNDVNDCKRLNSGGERHVVYYLHSEESNVTDESKVRDFWIANIKDYVHLYIYAMLFTWNEHCENDDYIKERLKQFQNYYFSKITSEINKFYTNELENFPTNILGELKFITDAFLWKSIKEVPCFTEEQKENIAVYCPYYERYIKLINDDNKENIAKYIDKYLNYCITLDKEFNKKDCLTSFILHLSEKKNIAIGLDAVLKSISAQSYRIDTIRSSITNGEWDVPAEIIKLAIYSKNDWCQKEELSENEAVQQKEQIRKFLNRASEDFNILTNNKTRLEVVDQLKISSYIRDYIANNENVSLICNQEASVNSTRQELLDKIMAFKNDIIQSLNDNVSSIIYCSKKIQDIFIAKKKLVDLLTLEIQGVREYMISNKEETNLCKASLQQHIKKCEEVISRCNDEKYIILLLGEYQSGKTTTLNAFCEGRNVGSIGDGTKTSAVPLAISYADYDEVCINWKHKDDIVEILLHIQKYLPDTNLKEIDIDDSQIRESIENKIDDVRKCGIKSKSNGDAQYLALSSMIMKFWKSESLEQLKNKTISLNEIRNLTKFPSSMVERWWKSGLDSFTEIEEVAFVFIEQIECKCSLELLKTMNCIILDAPGLYASDYDTQVAVNSMNKANAILYILPREKATGEQIEGSLKKIKKDYPDFHNKLFFANNLSFKEKNSTSIFEANKQKISQIFEVKYDVIPYDAQLAYYGQIKNSYDNGLLSDEEEQDFINTYVHADFWGRKQKFSNFNEAWKSVCGGAESANQAIKDSNFMNLKSELVAFIEKNKAYSILVSNGIGRLRTELESLQKHLYITYIEPYLNGGNELENQWNERVNNSLEFEEVARSKINEYMFSTSGKEPSVERRLSDAIYEKLFPSDVYTSLNEKICDDLYDNAKKLNELQKNEEEYKKFTTKLVSECLDKMICERISYCNSLLSSNQDKDFQNIFITAVDAFENNMDIIWSETMFNNDSIFKGSRGIYYTISKDTSTFSMTEKIRETNLSVDGKNITNAAIMKNVIGVGGAAISIGGYGIYFYACAVSGPIGWIIGGLAAVFGGLWFWGETDEYNKKKFRKKMMQGLEKQLNESGVKNYIKSIISDNINRILSEYIDGLKIDKEKLIRDKDAAIAVCNNPNLEPNCFNAINVCKKIGEQIQLYNDYYSKL